MAKFDPSKFNTDPKHQEERDFLDAIVEASAQRISDRKRKEKKPEEANFFDKLFSSGDE